VRLLLLCSTSCVLLQNRVVIWGLVSSTWCCTLAVCAVISHPAFTRHAISTTVCAVLFFVLQRLPLDSTVAQQLAEAGSPGIAKIFINDDPKISPIKPYQYLYGRYRR
jgi:hypothetical protein